ncbi:MAG: hypothetical protein HFJ48_00725 [Clostridia bacterium]|nr:hypothetical protein [Clostridia bacterium]
MNNIHKDQEWIESKMNGRSGCYGYDNIKGPAKIGYIYKVNKIKIIYYNIILFIRYLKRKVAKKL